MASEASQIRKAFLAWMAAILALLACGTTQPTPTPLPPAEPSSSDGSPDSPHDPLFQTGFGTDDPLPIAPDLWMTCSDDACSSAISMAGNVDFPIVETAPGMIYPSNAASGLWTPPLVLPSGNASELTFDLIYFTESEWDGMTVLITNDTGASWTTLEPDDGYPVASIYALGGRPGYSGLSTGWTSEVFTIRGFEGDTVVIMFFFASDPSIGAEGVGIDNISVHGTLAVPDLSLPYPPIQIEPSFDPNQYLPQATTRVPSSCMEDVGDSWIEKEVCASGTRSFIKGIDQDRTWLFVLSPLGNFCWIRVRDVEQDLDFDILPIIPDSPPPDEPPIGSRPPACQESLPQEACEASGGDWVSVGASAPHCECP